MTQKKEYVYISKLTAGEKKDLEVTVLSKAEEQGTYWVRDLYKPKSKKFVVSGDLIEEFNRLITVDELKTMRENKKNIKEVVDVSSVCDSDKEC